ncbi:MAG TPA: molybdopterin cofactor-binding domain-containing protein [Chloroflexota bacterium]|nr:molybdopterin cofactor-binding domain-containing protein [Chloroflexota bacterium]
MSNVVDEKGLSRLDFLKASGALVITFSIPLGLKAGTAEAASGPFPMVNPAGLDAWLAIGTDGIVTLFTGKVEIGMGATTGLAQVVAEELDVPMESMSLVLGDTARTPAQGITAGGTVVDSDAGGVLRQVAADARYALLQRAAAHLGVSPSSLTVKNGVVQVKGNSKKSVSYADLVGGKRFNTAVPAKTTTSFFAGLANTTIARGKGTPKKPSEYTIVGQSVPRLDIPDKVTGKFTFMQDVKVPGMLHGRVIRPKGIGSQLISHGKPPAGVQVVREGNFLGVVSENEWDAIQAAQNLDVKWSDWKGLPRQEDLYTTLRAMSSTYEVVESAGNVGAALQKASKRLQASYLMPIETHGSLGPSCAIADVKHDSATIWVGTQTASMLRQMMAQMLGMPLESVRVIFVEAAGNYGRNGADPCAADAAIMSRLTGKPVRVQWMRWDEHGWDPKGPAIVEDLVGGLDAKGKIVAWNHEAWLPSGSSTTLIGSVLAGKPVGSPSIGGWDGPFVYNVPNYEQIGHGESDIQNLGGQGVGIVSAWLRTPPQYQLNTGIEIFMDELAAAAGIDPVQFRLNHLTDWRMIDLLKAAAKRAGWQTRTSPKPNALTAKEKIATGRGVAVSLRLGSYNAEIAEVEVNRVTGKVRVTRFIVGQDNGLTVNPRAVELTMEAAITQTTSRALWEEVTFDQSNVTSTTWATYPILTFMDAPVIETVHINRPELPMTQAGEQPVSACAAAINNAVFDAIGVRVRQFPLRPQRVKAALKEALLQHEQALKVGSTKGV